MTLHNFNGYACVCERIIRAFFSLRTPYTQSNLSWRSLQRIKQLSSPFLCWSAFEEDCNCINVNKLHTAFKICARAYAYYHFIPKYFCRLRIIIILVTIQTNRNKMKWIRKEDSFIFFIVCVFNKTAQLQFMLAKKLKSNQIDLSGYGFLFCEIHRIDRT